MSYSTIREKHSSQEANHAIQATAIASRRPGSPQPCIFKDHQAPLLSGRRANMDADAQEWPYLVPLFIGV